MSPIDSLTNWTLGSELPAPFRDVLRPSGKPAGGSESLGCVLGALILFPFYSAVLHGPPLPCVPGTTSSKCARPKPLKLGVKNNPFRFQVICSCFLSKQQGKSLIRPSTKSVHIHMNFTGLNPGYFNLPFV